MGLRKTASTPWSSPPRAALQCKRSSRGGLRSSLVPPICILVLFLLAACAGCSSHARTYAQEARSNYITARAVLVGVEEFPSQMEILLRSGDINFVAEDASDLIDDVRGLLPTASSAFRTVSEKAELLAGEGNDRFALYADMLIQLTALGEQVISSYTELIGLSNSVLQGLPYGENPGSLMPTLDYMDEVAARILELNAGMKQLEEEAEALYREITG